MVRHEKVMSEKNQWSQNRGEEETGSRHCFAW